jgi:hypothetical protein
MRYITFGRLRAPLVRSPFGGSASIPLASDASKTPTIKIFSLFYTPIENNKLPLLPYFGFMREG